MRRWPSAWVMTSTIRLGEAAATAVMALGPRRCSPRSPVEIAVPRDTNSSFEPQTSRSVSARLTGIDEIVLSVTAKGLTTGEVAAHFADVYGATVSKDTISRITDKVIGEIAE
jgi:transposase-like protein